MSCSIGLHKLVKDILDDKPWFSYKEDGDFGLISIFDSPAKKINKETSVGVANRVTDAINNAINDGYKIIGQVAYSGYDATGRGMVRVNPTENQLNLINAADDAKEIYELQKQVEEEIKLKEQESKPIETFNKETQENKEYFENDEPFTRNSSSTKPNTTNNTNQQGTLFQLNDNSQTNNQSLQEGLQWLKEVNPNVQPEIVQGLIDGIANGSYNSDLDLITLSEEFADKKTVKHEFLHKLLNSLPFEQREAILNEASKKYGIARGDSKTTTKYSQVQQNEINYALKAVDILQSAKGDEIFRKGDKNNWDIGKILQELQIPKDQQDLIKSFNTRNREEIITNLLANYSYTVEINTTTKENDRGIDDEIIEHNGKFMLQTSFDDSGPYHEIFNTKQEAVSYLKKLRQNPTNYYSNLTVPGGTAYTEQEISTPLITPSIKGHAQFSTDNGIGWFRSDEAKEYKGELFLLNKYFYQTDGVKYNIEHEDSDGSERKSISKEEYENARKNENVNFINKRDIKNTRRILEVQSDLFQKWRNNFEFQGNKYTAKKDDKNVWHYYKNDSEINANEYTKVWETFLETYLDNADAFTKLLQKDNNWVTFFVKSIIQDSAKKGYEKVLFPSGNTASKVEGHTTLEEFKKQKEDRIKELETKRIEKIITNFKIPNNIKESSKNLLITHIKYQVLSKWISNTLKTEPFLELSKNHIGKNKDVKELSLAFRKESSLYKKEIPNYIKKLAGEFFTPTKDQDLENTNHYEKLEYWEDFNKNTTKYPRTGTILDFQDTLDYYRYNPFVEENEDVAEELEKQGITYNTILNYVKNNYTEEENVDNEINQLKQEIERVERGGFSALKPIYNFYENTVTNILNKTFGKENVKLITDEFGNTWNEINLSSEKVKQQTDKILFQSPKLQYTGDLAIEEKIAEEAENSKDEIVAKTPLQKFIQSIKNLLRNIFKEKDKISRLIRNLNQGNFNLQKATNDTEVRKILNTPIEIEQKVTPTEDNIIKDLVEIKESEVKKKLQEILDILGITIKEDAQLPKDILAKVDMVQKLISFSRGELTEDNFTEEVIHLIVNIIEQKDPTLYNKMISEIWKFNIYKEVLDTYRTDPEYQTKEGKPDMAKLKKEAVVKLLVAKLVDNTNINDTKNIFGALWDKVSKFIIDLFAQIPSYQRDIFEDFANDIVTKDNLISSEDANQLKDGVFYSKRMNKAGMFANILNKTKNLFGKEKVKDAYITVPTIENPEEMFNTLKTLDKETSLVVAKEINPKTGKEEDVTYYVTGTGNKKRVSTILQEVKTNIGNYKNIDETELSAFIKNEKMMQGTKIHSTIEEIVSRYVDLETGFLRITPLSRPENIDIPEKYYTILENHLKDRFISYPKGTRFMVELKVVNEVYGYAGTIDFLAILPTGQIDILDWKSMDLTSKIAGKTIKKEEVHALTKEVHKQQLALYKQALMSVGIRDFRQTRTIPIIVENNIKKINKDKSFEDPKNLTITLSSLEIGMVDTTKETKNYLLPISTSNEKVFDDVSNKPISFLNDLIDKLEAYKKHSLEQRNQATTLDRDRLLDQIQRTDKTIQELRSKKTTKLLVTIFEDELFNIDKLSEKRFSFLEDNKDLTDLTPEQQNELREYFNKMNENYEFLNSFMKIMPNLENLKKIQNEISPELAESISKVRLKIIKSEEQASNAVSHNMNLMGKLLGMDDNVANIDVKTGTLTTIFSLYSRPELSLQMFTRLQKTINYLRDKEVQTFDTKMSNLMQGITSWVKKTGNNIEQVYSKIYDKENKRLFYKFKKEYATTLYEKREEVFQKYREIVNSIPFQLSSTEKTKQIQKEYRAYITPFLNENYDITKYVKLYEEAYKEYKKVVDEYIFDADPFENEAIREQKLDDWEYKHNIFTNPKALMTSGYNRNELLFKTINEDKWLSDEYRELTKPENKELFDFYQQLSSILEDANNEGLIDSLNNLPEVKNDSFQMFKYLKAGLFKNYLLSKYYAFYDKFLTNTYRNSDRTDPFTNKAKRKIPRKYSNSFFLKRKKDESPEEYQKRYNEEKKLHDMTLSTDLFYIFSVFGHHLIEYKLMKEYESRFQLLSLVENQKSNLIDISNTTGEVQYSVDDSGMEYRAKDSKPNTTQDDNKTNRDLLRHIDNYLYSDKLAPEGAIKNIMDWLYNLTTQVNLGFTYTAPLTNLMAGLVNSSLNNNTYYNSKDFKNNIIPAIKDKNSPINTKTFEKLNNLFNPFVEMTDQVYSTNKYKSTDKKLVNFSKAALFLYSAGDHIIQNKIVASIYYGTTIDENNNIISVEDYINNKYPDRYSLSPKERLVLAKKIDKEIKEYKKTNSLYSLMTANKVNLNAQNTILLTSIIEDTISKTLGNYNQQDINTFQTQWIAKFVYQHKKWLGETIATRFEEFAVNNNTKQLEWGRYRLMADFLFSATQKALKKMLFYNMSSILPDMVVKNTTLNNTISVEDIAKERYKVMQVEYKKKTNKDLPTTENEFIRFYVRQHENTEKELKTLLTLLLLSKFLLPLLAGGGDDDDENKEKDIYGTALDVLITVTSRSLREQSFTINPEQLKIMLLQGPIPVIGTAWNILDAGIITPTKEIYFGLKGDTKALKTNRVIDKGLNATPLKNINKLGKQISPDYRKFLNARRPKIQ